MKKLILVMMVGALCLVGPKIAMASDYWVYSEVFRGTKYNYYVVEESLEAVKGAFHIDVKEVAAGGEPYRYKLGLYGGQNGQIMYYRPDQKPIEPRKSNGHDLFYAIWQYILAHEKGLY